MSVVRIDLNRCTGCGSCVSICPMDVFYYNAEERKSVIAYPENCQSCGQCYLNCRSRSLGISNDQFGYPITAYRGVTTAAMNRIVITEPGMITEFTKGSLPNTKQKQTE